MSFGAIAVLALLTVVLAAAGFVVFGLGVGEQQDVVRAERGMRSAGLRSRVSRPLDARLTRTRAGQALARALVQANLRRIYAIEYAALALAAAFLTFIAMRGLVAPFYAVASALGILWAAWGLLSFLRRRQRERFIAQLPEFARIMANSTSAGLSIHSAVKVAAAELPDPAGREVTGLERELAIGTPLDVGLERMSERIAGRDLTVLVNTLVISHRSGGSLISALRGMSETLEHRKETKREVRTLVTQSSFTGYLVVLFGVGLVLVMNWISPGVIHKLTTTVLGQIGLAFAALAYGIGLFAINRLVRVKL